MPKLNADAVWNMTESDLLTTLEKGLLQPKQKQIHFYAPSFMSYKTSYFCSSPRIFPIISLTGKGCRLKCSHCGGRVLGTMHPATSPKKLFELCAKLKQDGALGCLVSGGCQPNGSVPLGRFVNAIRKAKKELGLTIFVHTGIIDLETALTLKKIGIDAALIDIIGSNETIKEIHKLNTTVDDYANSLKALHEANLTYSPHIVVGLHHGKLRGELEALRIVSRYTPSALIIIAFQPIRGTEMEKTTPPAPIEVARVIAAARLMFPQTPLVLGCMRPKGTHRIETDVLALKAGIDAIAFPAEETVKLTDEQGYNMVFSLLCCSHIYSDARSIQASDE